ncbi:unnamed protein product, partial [Adineta steineri]
TSGQTDTGITSTTTTSSGQTGTGVTTMTATQVTDTGMTTATSTSSSTTAVTTITSTVTTTTVSATSIMTTAVTTPFTIVCSCKDESVTGCTLIQNLMMPCNSSTSGFQTIETTCNCNNNTHPIVNIRNISCVPNCPVTVTQLNQNVSATNLLMRVTSVPLPFSYQYTNETASHKVLYVTDKGYITLDKPFYAIQPTQSDTIDIPYIAPFWTNLIYVNETTSIMSVIYNGLSPTSREIAVVQDTVIQQNQTPIYDEALAYRVVKIEWNKLVTNLDSSNNNAASGSQNIVFDAYLINGPGAGFTTWNSYLRFEYTLNSTTQSPNYQPVIIGYRGENATAHLSSVSFTNQITDFINEMNKTRTYFLSSRILSTCEQWYWATYTDILFQRSVNFTTVKRNPCPCSYSQASSDFRFTRMDSENRLELSNNVACFVPLTSFTQRASDATSYQQTCCYFTDEDSLITSGEFAGSIIDQSTLQLLQNTINNPQRIQERDWCCIANNGTIDWSQWCNLYYELRPASICDGYEPPQQAWFGGDPHIQTSDNANYTCNVYGSFIYAQTTNDANITANNNTDSSSTILKDLISNELFSIVARTSKSSSLLRANDFFNQTITYFSSFTMYLGSNNSVIIDVSIEPTNNYQFRVRYLTVNNSVSRNPFNLSNDFVEYFYYPTSSNNTTPYTFSIIKENQTISANNWNTYSTTQQIVSVQVQKLTISTWSGLAMQCYLITNNMACTLLLPQKYTGNIQGLAFGNYISNDDQYCVNYSSVANGTEVLSLDRSSLITWFNTAASPTYRNYINNISCPFDKTSTTYNFCVQDTLLSQSSLLGQLTAKSSIDYTTADTTLSVNPPKITLVQPTSFDTPYTYLLIIPYTDTLQNETFNYIDVTVDSTSSIIVQVRDRNTSTPVDCIFNGTLYSCPFSYTTATSNLIQLTILAIDIINNITSYQRVSLVVNECMNGQAVWTNPTILSSSVSVLYCVCDEISAGEFCERSVSCADLSACQLNFLSNVTCITNLSIISTNSGRAPYQCINSITNISCSNNSECCQKGYGFNTDIQQCLCN